MMACIGIGQLEIIVDTFEVDSSSTIKKKSKPFDFDKIPDDLVKKILSFAFFESLLDLPLVSKRFESLINKNPLLWRKAFLQSNFARDIFPATSIISLRIYEHDSARIRNDLIRQYLFLRLKDEEDQKEGFERIIASNCCLDNMRYLDCYSSSFFRKLVGCTLLVIGGLGSVIELYWRKRTKEEMDWAIATYVFQMLTHMMHFLNYSSSYHRFCCVEGAFNIILAISSIALAIINFNNIPFSGSLAIFSSSILLIGKDTKICRSITYECYQEVKRPSNRLTHQRPVSLCTRISNSLKRIFCHR